MTRLPPAWLPFLLACVMLLEGCANYALRADIHAEACDGICPVQP